MTFLMVLMSVQVPGVTFSFPHYCTTEMCKFEHLSNSCTSSLLIPYMVNDVLHNPGAFQMGILFMFAHYINSKMVLYQYDATDI